MVDFLIGQYCGALQTEDHDANDLDDVEVHSQIGAGNLESVHAHDRIGQPQPNAFRKSSHGTHCRNPPSGFQRSSEHGMFGGARVGAAFLELGMQCTYYIARTTRSRWTGDDLGYRDNRPYAGTEAILIRVAFRPSSRSTPSIRFQIPIYRVLCSI